MQIPTRIEFANIRTISGSVNRDIMTSIELLVALLYYQQLDVVIEFRVGMGLVFGWFHADGAKLFDRISQQENNTLRCIMVGTMSG